MRKVTAGLFHSIDGVVEAPNLWQYDQFDEELAALLSGVQERVDAVVMGRKGYEEWAGYWPAAESDGDFADFINAAPKYVASRTLQGPLAWRNAKLIEGDLEGFVRELKSGRGGEIAVMASISVVRQLFLLGLLDELTLITHPVIAGENRRHLFEARETTTRLELRNSVRTSKGNLVATYALRSS